MEWDTTVLGHRETAPCAKLTSRVFIAAIVAVVLPITSPCLRDTLAVGAHEVFAVTSGYVWQGTEQYNNTYKTTQVPLASKRLQTHTLSRI